MLSHAMDSVRIRSRCIFLCELSRKIRMFCLLLIIRRGFLSQIRCLSSLRVLLLLLMDSLMSGLTGESLEVSCSFGLGFEYLLIITSESLIKFIHSKLAKISLNFSSLCQITPSLRRWSKLCWKSRERPSIKNSKKV